ncbi:tetratricopeptide repeat protein [Candidatus Odyssella thessalonicensis]|uniref:tetratricopeptide repeat protein n=1 Tax=Candidatus Odyssella thessalonicensis TaxID=84647 RepID=UPI000225AC68|nr:sel1 repeat family protein [Candidatus Odyssella thessalonicensis]
MRFPNLIRLTLSFLIFASSQFCSAMQREKEESLQYASRFVFLEEHLNISPSLKQFFMDTSEEELRDKLSWIPNIQQFHSPELNELFRKYKPTSINIFEVIILNTLYDKFKDSFDTLINVAKAGHADAQYKVATGLCFEEDENSQRLAKELLHKAAAQGHRDSIYKLSDAYNRTADYYQLEKNPHIAYLLCQEAAAMGHEEAQLELASAPLDGTFGLPKNYSLARAQIKSLADNGNQLAVERYNYLKDKTEEEYDYLSNL